MQVAAREHDGFVRRRGFGRLLRLLQASFLQARRLQFWLR